MLITTYKLNREIEKGELRNLYLFSGEEHFLKEDSLRKLKAKLITPEMEPFNYNLLHGFETDYGQIIAAAQSLPMFAEKRLVVVKHAEAMEDQDLGKVIESRNLPKNKKDQKLALLLSFLEEYLKNPSPFTVLTFVYNENRAFWERGKKPEFGKYRRKEFKLLQNYCTEVSFRRLSEERVKTWITEHARKNGYTITPEGVSYLIDLLGTDLTAIANELQKCFIGLGERREIGVEYLEGSAGRVHYHRIFELTDAIGGKDLARSLKILHRIIEDGYKPLHILNSLSRHLTKIASLKEDAGKAKLSPQRDAQKGFKSTTLEKLKRQSDMFTPQELASMFQYLSHIDIACKTTSLKPQFLLENLLMELCQGKGVKIITFSK